MLCDSLDRVFIYFDAGVSRICTFLAKKLRVDMFWKDSNPSPIFENFVYVPRFQGRLVSG